MLRHIWLRAGSSVESQSTGADSNLLVIFLSITFHILPYSILILSTPRLLQKYCGRPISVRADHVLVMKSLCALVLFLTKVHGLVLWDSMLPLWLSLDSRNSAIVTNLACLESISLGLLIYVEDRRQRCPSTRLSAYLAFSICVESATLWSYGTQQVLAVTELCSLCARILLLFWHEQSKWSRILENMKTDMEPSAANGTLQRLAVKWLNSSILWHLRGELNIRHLDALDDISSRVLLEKFEPHWNKCRSAEYIELTVSNPDPDRRSRYGLMKSCIIACKWPLVAACVMDLLVTATSLTYPLLVQEVVQFAERSDTVDVTRSETDEANSLILASAVLFLLQAVSKLCFSYILSRAKSMVIGTLTVAICKKILSLPDIEAPNTFELSFLTTHLRIIMRGIRIWIKVGVDLVQTGFCVYFIWQHLGPATLCLFIPIAASTLLSNRTVGTISSKKDAWLQQIQSGTSVTAQLLGNIRGIKLTNREEIMVRLIQELREGELNSLKTFYRNDFVRMGITVSIHSLGPAVIIANDLVVPGSIDAMKPSDLFMCLALMILLFEALLDVVEDLGFEAWQGALSSFSLIQDFLNYHDAVDERQLREYSDQDQVDGTISIQFNRSIIAPRQGSNLVLYYVDLTLCRGTCTLVRGATGVGKTTLLRTILGQTEIIAGQVHVSDCLIGYCGQMDWIQNRSIKDVIIGGKPFDRALYLKVICACLLVDEFKRFRKGDNHLTGRNGCNLSAVFQERVALARAAYSRAPIIVMDDSLCKQDMLSLKTLLSRLLGPHGILKTSTVMLSTSHPIPYEGIIDQAVYIDAFGRVDATTTVDGIAYISTVPRVDHHSEETDEEPRLPSNLELDTAKELTQIRTEETIEQRGNKAPYWFLYQNTSKLLIALWAIAINFTIVFEGALHFYIRTWLQYRAATFKSHILCLFILSLSGPMFVAANVVFYQIMTISALRVVHQQLVKTILRTEFSFYSPENCNQIISLFRGAMFVTSRHLPMNQFQAVYMSCTCIIIFCLAISSIPLIVVVIPFIPVLGFLLHRVHCHSVRQFCRLHLRTSESLYSHVTEMGTGLAHIRAFRQQRAYMTRSYLITDRFKRSIYYESFTPSWLHLAVNLFYAILAPYIVFLAVHQQVAAYEIGICLVSCLLSLPFISIRILEQWVSMDTALTGFEKVRSFIETTPQVDDSIQPTGNSQPPSRGHVVFKDVSIQYRSGDDTPILENVNLVINSGDPVSLYGNRASGQSTLLYALLNLVSYTGSIKIDGVEMRELAHRELRSRITVIPENPVIFPGTVRENLLPEELMSKNVNKKMYTIVIDHILDSVGLLYRVRQCGGISARFSDLNLSQMQLQRFSLAQALMSQFISQSKILLIDNATSGVDTDTREDMEQIIRDIFGACAIVTAAYNPAAVQTAKVIGTVRQRQITFGLNRQRRR